MTARRVAAWAAGLVVAALGAATLWYQFAYLPPRLSRAAPEALAALSTDAAVRVTDDSWVTLWPAAGAPATGFIFYPGGEVEAEGYAEPLRAIAAAGFPVVLVRMPFYLAVAAPDRAEKVMAAYPQVRRWVIGGHSLGGAMAARFVSTHPGRMAGLLLWDAYAAPENDLSAAALPVMQLYRTGADGAPPAAYREARHLLPPQTELVEVPGGSHMNYGRFVMSERIRGMAADVHTASVPLAEQHGIIAAASIAFLREVDSRAAPAGAAP